MADDKQFRSDLVDVIIQTLTFGIMKNINGVLKEAGYSGDDLFNVETDSDGNPINHQNWDFRPMNSNRPRPDAPYLLVGRIVDWADDDWGMAEVQHKDTQQRVKDEEGLMVESTTTGATEDGTLLVDGLVNFERNDVHINQYVAKLDDVGNEVDDVFVQKTLSPHKVRLQDPLFYDDHGGADYKIYHTDIDRAYRESGETTIRLATHANKSDISTRSAYAMKHYLETLKAQDDLIQVELEKRDQGEVPAWVHVSDIGDTIDASRIIGEDERQKGVQHRKELNVSLKMAEVLHRLDPALESDLRLNIMLPEGE